ncbi:MAG TPA: alpha/beta hydrolase-fold protein, partial [Thermoanaerobaculia bacterium]
FVADELIPWARKTYRTSESRSRTIIGGLSRGAGMASYVGLHYPQRISKVISLSTALENFPGAFPPARFWLTGDNGWLIDRYMERPHQPLELYLAVGRLDTGPWTERLVNNRRFRDVLRLKGYKVHYNEWNGGHDPLFWQRGFVEGLTALAPGDR